ncbi:MAG: NAD(P)-dependent oxidoreductase [Phycisphaerae bacterium]|nr:NAD(P)-dependent oxidoreductase [Phycisphaerae bacterium]
MRVLVTGAAGFIGNAAARECLRRGADVVALIHRRLPQGLEHATLVRAPMHDPAALRTALTHHGPFDAAIHCAGRATDIGLDAAFRAANYDAVLRLIGCMDAARITRLVHVSTTDVYGLRDFTAADERTPLRSTVCNPYPRYKILAEKAIARLLPRSRYAILRPAAVWGPGDRSILPRVLRYLSQNRSLVHFGRWAGRNRWPLAHVDNVARAAWLACTAPEAAGEAFNVLDEEFTTIDEYYRLLLSVCLGDASPRRSIRVPLAVGWLMGIASTLLSNALGRDAPLFEPSLYDLYAAACNLDFSRKKIAALFAAHGEPFVTRSEGLAGLANIERTHA